MFLIRIRDAQIFRFISKAKEANVQLVLEFVTEATSVQFPVSDTSSFSCFWMMKATVFVVFPRYENWKRGMPGCVGERM